MLKRRVLSSLIALVVFVSMLPSSMATLFAAPTSTSFVNGTMDSEWTIINPVTAGDLAYELVKGSGLKLRTQPSGMQQGSNADNSPSNPGNVFTYPANATSWEAVAKVYYPKAPAQNYQQIAFGVYQDANNYMKVDIEYNSGYGGRMAQFSINRNGTYTHTHRTMLSINNTAFTSNSANRITDLVAYYKIIKNGTTYTASVSFNGIDYVTVGTTSSNTNGQYTASYAEPKLFVSAIKDTTYSSVFDAYCEFVKVYNVDGGAPLNVLTSALQDVTNYVNAEATNFSGVNSSMSLAAGNRYNDLLFSQFPTVPYGYTYKLVPGDPNLLIADEDGVISAQRPGNTSLDLCLVNGNNSQTLKTINVTIADGIAPVTVTFNYNYSGAPAAPASFVKQTVGGKLQSFPVEQTLPQYGSRQNFGFTGWYTSPSGGQKVTLDTVFSTDTALYAHWEEVPSLYEEYEDYFIMGAFQDYSYNANPAEGSAQYIYNKHYKILCPSNNFKLSNMINTTAMRNNFTAARTSILANNTLTDEQKQEQIARANEQVVLNANPGVNNQLNALRNWNNANPNNKKYTRFHVVAWHGGQQPDAFFGNGFSGGTSTTLRDEPWTASQDGAVASRETMKARLENYIKLLMERYKDYADLIVSWDIVNEPVDDYSGQIRNNFGDSKSQSGGQWGRVWHDRNPARNLDGTIKYTTAADSMGVINDQNRLYDESEWIRWAFESAAKWTKTNNMSWALYLNDYMDSNKLYTKLQPTLDILKWIRNDVDLQGVKLAYGFQGRLAWAYPTIDMLRKQADDALAISDIIGVTEADIRSDFEPNPFFNPFQATKPFASGLTPAWGSDPNTAGSGSTSQVGGSIGNTVDAHNSPVRRMPEFGSTNGMTAATVNRLNKSAPDGREYKIVSNGELFAISEQNMKHQADFAADWMDILIERADKVELYQWDNYTDSSTFNSSKAAHIWVNSGVGRTGTFEKYAFFAVVGAPARDKLKTAINAFPPSYWEANATAYAEAQALLNKRIYTLEGVNDVKAMTAALTSTLDGLSNAYITYDANGGTGSPITDTFTKNANTNVKAASEIGFTKAGYALKAWNTSANGVGQSYAPGDAIAMNTSVRLYAQWEKAPSNFTVAFESYTNGTGTSLADSAYASVQVAKGATVAKPTVNPTKDGFKFRGWFRDMATTKLWNFDTPVTENMRLYAGYEEVPPARAASITVGGQPLVGFSPSVYNYTLSYEQAQATAPIVAATAEESDEEVYSVSLVQATAIPGVAKVTVSGMYTQSVYTINFVLKPPRLSNIELDNAPLAGFDPETLSYAINCKGLTTAPVVTTATAAFQGLNVNIVQATSIPGAATITVSRDQSDAVVYTIRFTVGPTGDSFVAGKMDDLWTVLNKDSAQYSLVKGRGLRLPTLQGDIYGTNRSWNNVFIREAEGDWEVVAKVFYPNSTSNSYQQIMLLGWSNEDNYVKLDCEGTSATARSIQFARELNGSCAGIGSNTTATSFNNPDGSLTLWFRLRKVGNVFTAAYSRDGITYTNQPSAGTSTTLAGVTHIGVFATKNSANATIDTYCEYVEFTQHDGETLMTNAQVLQKAVDNVADYVAADLPTTTADNLSYSLMPRGYTITAVSGDTDTISNTGIVTPQAYKVTVPYAITVSDGTRTAVRNVSIEVPGSGNGGFGAKLKNNKIEAWFDNMAADTSAVSGSYIAAVYDGGRLLKIETLQLSVAAGELDLKTFAMDMSNYSDQRYTVKVFCWDPTYLPLGAAANIK